MINSKYMKKLFLIFTMLLLFIYYSSLLAQYGWQPYSTGTTKGLNDIYFVNVNTGWAVGDSTVVKSTNGGINWIRQNCFYNGTSTPLYSVRFINDNTGYIAGGFMSGEYNFTNYIFKTTNGGINWNIIFDQPTTMCGVIYKIFPVNENIIFITQSGVLDMTTFGGLSKSTNGGLNFSIIISHGGCNTVYFVNANTGWTSFYYFTDFGYPKTTLYKTTNSGSTWNLQYRDSLGFPVKISDLQFINETTGFIIGSNFSSNKTVFFKTSNGGTNWDTIYYNHTRYRSIFFINQYKGWIAGDYSPDSSSIAFTSDNGSNWTLQIKRYNIGIRNLFFIDSQNGWATTSVGGTILRTINGGVTGNFNLYDKEILNYYLSQNYPNPFNPTTKIKFSIPSDVKRETSEVRLIVYDILGKEITTLVNEQLQPGTYEVTFDGSNYPNGIYFYKLSSGEFTETMKMLMIK